MPTSPRISLKGRIPPGSWDSHMHILDPNRYPLSPTAIYTPGTHTLSQALAFENDALGIHNIVLVQPSIYGTDNTCILDALAEMPAGSQGRAVVDFDPATTGSETLREWHALGVRGVRVNFKSLGRTASAEELRGRLGRVAGAVRELGWVVQVYVSLEMVELLEPIVHELDVRVCIDHLGHPSLPEPTTDGQEPVVVEDPYSLVGFASLTRLLQGGMVFVKLSAPYRISKRGDNSDLEPIVKEILKVAGKSRVVFATDWPHTRFEGLDICPWVETVLDWCGDDQELVERLFRGNAEDLWS